MLVLDRPSCGAACEYTEVGIPSLDLPIALPYFALPYFAVPIWA